MSNNHLYARRKSDGKIVSVDDVENGLKLVLIGVISRGLLQVATTTKGNNYG